MTRNDALLMAGIAAGSVLMGAALAAEARRARLAIELDGRAALITGGSRGLGLLIARELGQHGARVMLMARDQAELDRAERKLRAEGIEVSTIAGDVTREEDARRAVEAVVSRYGAIDVLVNNAGAITVGPLDHVTRDDYEAAMAVHFWGPLYTMEAAIPHMRTQRGGRIANISSFGGKLGVPHMVPYSASKFALAGLSGALTPELARDNIADSLPLLSTSGGRAAAQIVDAIRHGDAELVITWAAKLAVIAAAIMPNTVALALQVASTLLPDSSSAAGDERRSGWQSMSDWAPSALTRLAEQAALENNETGGAPINGRPA